MMRNNLQLLFITALFALGLTAALPAVAAPPKIIELGTLHPSHTRSIGLDVNERGMVVGSSSNSNQVNAFLWTAERGMISLGTLGGNQSVAWSVNNRGEVVGFSRNNAAQRHAFIWTMASGLRDLGTLGGNVSLAYGINDRGQIVGYSSNSDGHQRAFLWTEQDGMVDLGTLGGEESRAFNAGEAGHIVGWSTTAAGEKHAFLWTAQDGMVDLGSLGGGSAAYDVNGRGQIVGESCLSGDFDPARLACTDGSPAHAFLWTAAGGMIDLGTLGGDWSWASGINNHGQVTGTSENAVGQRRAFLWTAADGMVDLGALPGEGRSTGIRISERGHIVGNSGERGVDRATLWTVH